MTDTGRRGLLVKHIDAMQYTVGSAQCTFVSPVHLTCAKHFCHGWWSSSQAAHGVFWLPANCMREITTWPTFATWELPQDVFNLPDGCCWPTVWVFCLSESFRICQPRWQAGTSGVSTQCGCFSSVAHLWNGIWHTWVLNRTCDSTLTKK